MDIWLSGISGYIQNMEKWKNEKKTRFNILLINDFDIWVGWM